MLYDARFSLRDFPVDKVGREAIRARSHAFIGERGRIDSFEHQVWRVIEGRVEREAVLLLPPLDQPALPSPWHGGPVFMRQDVVFAALGRRTRRHHCHDVAAASLCLIPDAMQLTPLVFYDRRDHRAYVSCADMADRHDDPIVLGVDCGGAVDGYGRSLTYIKACFGKDNVRSKLAASAARGCCMWGNDRTEDYLRRLGAEEIEVVVDGHVAYTLADLVLDAARYCPEKKEGPDPSLSLSALLGYPAPLFRDFSRSTIDVSTSGSSRRRLYAAVAR